MNLGVSLLTFLVIVAVTTGRSISNNDKDGKKKTSAIDLGFLIENPGNEGTEGEEPLKGVKDAFLQSRDFVQDLAKYFKVSVSGAHIGVVTYGTEPYMAFDFNEHLSNQQVKDALSGLTRPSRGSKVTKALKFVRDQLFEGSARPDARKILIILASKGARGDLPRIADQLKKSGVTIYSIAVDSTKLGAISLNDVVSDPIKNHRFKSDSTNLRGLVTKMKDLILNPKPKRKSSVLERLQNINASDTMKDAPEHIEPKDMKWVDISNYNQKDTKQPQDIPNQVVSSKDPTDHSTPMLPDGHDNPTTPEVPQDEPKSPDVPSEVPERNGAQNDTPKVNKVLENDPKDPANEHPEDVPKVSKSPEDIRTVHEVSENVPKDPANGHPEDVPKVSKSPGDIPKVHDASENVPNIPENAQDTPNVPNDSEETEVPHDTPKVDDLHEPNVKKDISKVSKVSEDTPKAPEIPKDSLEEPKTHKKVPKVRNHSPSGPGMTTTEPSDTPNDPKEPNDTPKNGSVGHLPDVSPELESTSTLNFTQDELPETRTIKSAGYRPSPTAQVSNPTMSSDALPKFGNSQEPAKLSTPKDADPMKAEPVMASSELPSRNEPSAEKKITTGQPDKESSSKSLPDAPAPDIDMPKTQALAAKASKQAKQTDNPTPEKTNEPSPETSTESGPDSPASPKESNSDNPNSEVPNPDNTVEETSNKPSPDSSPEQTPKDKSPDSPIEETPKEQSPDSPIEETPKEQSPDNPEPKPPKDSNKDKPAKEKPKKKKIQKSKTKSDVVKSGKSEEQITPDMPMSGLPVEELPSDLPPPDSPPPVKAKKISTKKGQPKDMTPKSPSQETPNEPSSDSTEIETPKKISPNTPATETPETNQDNSAEETPKEPSPDSPAPEEANEESPDGPGQEGPDESSPDSPDQDKSKKSSTKKSSPKKPKGKKRKISKKNKKKRHGLIKLLAKTVKTLKPKMPLPDLVRSTETYQSPAKRVSMPRAVNSSVQENGDEGLEYDIQNKLFGGDSEDEEKSSDEKNDEESDDDSKPHHKHTQRATDVIGKQCKARVDIAFLLDGSKQVGKEHFHKSVKFVKKLIKSFTVSRDQTHISLTVCSERPHILFDLKAFNDHKGMKTAMQSLSYPNGKLFTGGCLKTIRTGVFENSGRHDVPKILYFISGGKSRDNVDLPSRALRDMGVQVFSLGIGDKYNGVELKTMSTAPYGDHVMATKYEVLSLLRPYVSAQLCRGAGGKLEKPAAKPAVVKVKKHVDKPTPSQKSVFNDTGDSQIKAQVPKLEKKKSSTKSVKKTDLKKVKAKRRALLKADIKKKLHFLLSNFTKNHNEKAVYRSVIENINGHQLDVNCKDHHVLCKSWGSEGLCNKNSKYGIDFISVQHVCPKTCAVCYS